MRKLFLALLLISASIGARGQSASKEEFVKADIPAEFPGGLRAFGKFVSNNLVLKDTTAKDIKMYVSFVIDIDGSVDNVLITKDPGFGLGEEAVRVVRLSPKWNPAVKDGKAVRFPMIFPIAVKIEPTIEAVDKIVPFSEVEVKPEFPGGIHKLNQWVSDKLRLPDVKQNISIVAIASFTIEKDGSMSDIRVEIDPGYGLAQEVVRVLKKNKKKWKPGTIGGSAVRTSHSMPVKFSVKV